MKRLSFICVLLLSALMLAPNVCMAHRLNVFAWLENNNIMVSCNFGSQRPAINAQVKIMDAETKAVLNEGQTNAEGTYSFPAPAKAGQKNGLLIEVDAGQGHHGKWEMDASELSAAASLEAGFKAAKMEPLAGSVDPVHADNIIPAQNTFNNYPANALTEEQIRNVVTQAIAPLQNEIASLAGKGPGIAEIIGGIGWIIGLIGIGMYFKARK